MPLFAQFALSLAAAAAAAAAALRAGDESSATPQRPPPMQAKVRRRNEESEEMYAAESNRTFFGRLRRVAGSSRLAGRPIGSKSSAAAVVPSSALNLVVVVFLTLRANEREWRTSREAILERACEQRCCGARLPQVAATAADATGSNTAASVPVVRAPPPRCGCAPPPCYLARVSYLSPFFPLLLIAFAH